MKLYKIINYLNIIIQRKGVNSIVNELGTCNKLSIVNIDEIDTSKLRLAYRISGRYDLTEYEYLIAMVTHSYSLMK